ncbi:molybdopterin-guanine dinucleotide biosynthesis protein B [Vogesella fluminis]|uniref:Molybdopterin-guanine dinucleotide biosynthesis protein MobB n=2 Tax=Vogesella fluminis TaxID=1069161 RepID=A0ABQ3HBU9_9NEIS|nr:molybdopterin-guanine dinucleotide biosynthesis protein MobB [Vogesella fluminis]
MQKVLGIAGWSGSGKTTLIGGLLPLLAAHGLTVSVIKHSHHDIELDVAGKDSRRHRASGAHEVMVVSPYRFGLFAETPQPLTLQQQLSRLAAVDLVLLEGQKTLPLPRIEVHRAACGKPWLYPDDPFVIALATDTATATTLPQLPLDDHDAIAGFIVNWLKDSA